MSFRIEVRHPSLNRVRVVEGSDPYLVRQEALAQLETWDRLWEGSQEGPSTLGQDQESRRPEDGRELANALTHQAQTEIRKLGEVLSAPFPSEALLGWNEPAFPEQPPEPPPLPDPVPRPSPEQDRFRPRMNFLEGLVPPLTKKRQGEAAERFQRALSAWHREEERVRQALEAHQAAFEAWDRRRKDFEAGLRVAAGTGVRSQRAAPGGTKREPVERLRDLLLSAHVCPIVSPDYRLEFDGDSGHVRVHQRLPAPEDLPTLERVIFREEQGDFLEVHLRPEARAAAFDSVVYQSVLRTLRVLFVHDEKARVTAVSVNGWIGCRLPSTGRQGKLPLLSLTADRDQFLALDLDRVDPEACFVGLGGRRAARPHDLMPLGEEDSFHSVSHESGRPSRTGSLSRVGDSDDGPGLAGLHPSEFQRVMMRFLQDKVFPKGGAVLTVAEADGSMEAIGSGSVGSTNQKFLVHVKQSLTPLELGAVEALQARMVEERAEGGILISLGGFSQEAERAGEEAGLTLLGGFAAGKVRVPSQHSPKRRPSFPSGEPNLPGLTTPQ